MILSQPVRFKFFHLFGVLFCYSEKQEDDSQIVTTLSADDLVTKISIIGASTKIHAFQCLELGPDKAKVSFFQRLSLSEHNFLKTLQWMF